MAIYMGRFCNQEGKIMKTFLLLIFSSVVVAGVLPSLPAKIILLAFVLLAALIEGARAAKVEKLLIIPT